jgi:hypothetical protein
MLGLYYLPKIYISHECGLTLDGASKGLNSAIEAGFCSYDDHSEMVWVYEMATYQISEQLKPEDKRVLGVQNEYNNIPECPYLLEFFNKYKSQFCMTLARGNEAPTKPLASQEHEQEQDHKQEQELDRNASAEKSSAPKQSGKALPKDWVLPKAWGEWALSERPDLTADDVRKISESFKDHWLSTANQAKSKRADWEATWRNWIRRQEVSKSKFKNKSDVISDSQFDDWLNSGQKGLVEING